MIDFVLETTPLLYAGVFVFGALLGSFLHVVILRLPAMLEYDWRCQCTELLELETEPEARPPGIAFSRSKCPKCGHQLRAWENIPFFSYLVLRGKCRSCKTSISPRYPFVELLTAVTFLLTIWGLGPNVQGLSALFLTAVLITVAGIDFDHQLLPDNLTLPLMWAGLILAFWSVHVDLQSSVAGAAAGYLSLWIIYHLFRLLTGKEGMGYGDFKLLGALGAWMGWQMLPIIILLSSVTGAIVGLVLMGTGRLQRDKPMPFGPYIAMAGWIAMVWGEDIAARFWGAGSFG